MTNLHADEAFLGHYQFSHDPFAPRVPGFKFFPAQRKPVLGQLHHLARYSQLLLTVTGPRGSGKTLLRQALVASTNKQSVQSVVIAARSGGVDAAAVLRQIAQGLAVAQADLRSILAQVAQLSLTGQEVYLLVDDAELLDDSALQALLALAAGDGPGHPHVFLFASSAVVPRLESLADGEECVHVIELQPYSRDEMCEYLAQRLEGAGQGIELLSEEQLEDIHEQSSGWPGLVNQVARDVMIEAMLAERAGSRATGAGLKLPLKHLVALVVVAVGVTAAWFMQSSSEQPVSSPELALQQPADMPLGRPASSEGAAPAVEFAGANQPLPLPLVGEAQPVIRQPLAQAAGEGEADEPAADLSQVAPPVVAASQPGLPVVPQSAQIAPTPTPTPTPTPVPVAQAAKPIVAPAPVKAVVPVSKPVAATPAKPAPAAAKPAPVGLAWYAGQPATHFALQVFGTRTESAAKGFVAQQGGQYHYYRKSHQGQALYVVTYGSFATRAAAQAAVKAMPAKLQAGKPFPKSFASIKQEIAR